MNQNFPLINFTRTLKIINIHILKINSNQNTLDRWDRLKNISIIHRTHSNKKKVRFCLFSQEDKIRLRSLNYDKTILIRKTG